jgi:hypothetical protein
MSAAAMPSGAVTLGQIAARLPCWTCPATAATGAVAARLLAEHGAELPVPELRRIVAADCPRMQAGRIGLTLPVVLLVGRHSIVDAPVLSCPRGAPRTAMTV